MAGDAGGAAGSARAGRCARKRRRTRIRNRDPLTEEPTMKKLTRAMLTMMGIKPRPPCVPMHWMIYQQL